MAGELGSIFPIARAVDKGSHEFRRRTCCTPQTVCAEISHLAP